MPRPLPSFPHLPPFPCHGKRRAPFSVARKRGGFSLIEVLLAVLILGISLSVFFGALGQGVAIVGSAREYEISRTLLNRVEMIDPLDLDDFDEGETGGTFGGDFRNYRWRRIVRLHSTEEDELYHIETRVEWGDARAPFTESVETLLHLPTARRAGWVKTPADGF